MSNPSLARKDDDDRRFYVFGDESFWSVTTIIGGGVPKYLQAHYAKLAAQVAFDAILERGPYSRPGAIIRRLAARGRANVVERQARGELKSIRLDKLTSDELALRWIKGAAERHRDAAAQRGTDIHGEVEKLVLQYAREAVRLSFEGLEIPPWPDEIAAWQPGIFNWINDHRPIFLAAEATVFNRRQAYAGTLDAVCQLHLPDGRRPVPVVDLKTGNEVYDDVALQLSAYARGEFIGHPDGRTELAMPTVDSGAVLHLNPKLPRGYRFQWVRIDDPVFEAFKFAREVYRWKSQTGKTVFLGDVPFELEAIA